MKLKILFVDDERFKQKYYVEALEREGFEVHFEVDAEVGVELLSKDTSGYVCAVIDVMMLPPPRDWADLTVDGQFTGIELLVRAGDSVASLPILMLSQKATGEVKARYAKELSQDLRDALVIEFRHKVDTPSEDLPGIVKRLIRKFQRTKGLVQGVGDGDDESESD